MQANITEDLKRLRDAYLRRVPEDLDGIAALVSELASNGGDRTVLAEIHRRLHSIAGSAGSFGLSDLSDAARRQEQQVKTALSADHVPAEPRLIEYLDLGVARLREVLAAADGGGAGASLAETAPRGQAGSVLWLVEERADLGSEPKLVGQLDSFGYDVRFFAAFAEAEAALARSRPDILIVDVTFGNERCDATVALNAGAPLGDLDCPLFFISSRNDFNHRMRAAQLGAEGYFVKPVDVSRLVNRMVQVFEQRDAPPGRVLIVDDDVLLAERYRLTLLAAGMEAAILEQSEAIVDTVSAFQPDLVLMDIHMPDFSGTDLAGVIRQHESWSSLPIVYLSGETDLASQISAMSRGADDFLTKPVSGAQLVAAVRARIARHRQLNAQITKDSLTGLLKHASIKEAVDTEVLRASRTGTPVSLAILDIDHFKLVNDSHGHAVGDVVISSVAMLLRQRLRRSDILGRYGGEEFVVVLSDCRRENAVALLDELRCRFARVQFQNDGETFRCTLSAGVASTEANANASGADLRAEADRALYEAKRNGRDQVRGSLPSVHG